MKYLKYVLGAIVVYVVLLLVLLPASFVVSKLPLQRGVTLGSAQGTLWHGHLDFIRYQGVTVNSVKWNFSFSSLLLGQLVIDTTIGRRNDDIRGGGLVGYSFSGVIASDFKLSAPVEVLTKIQPLPLGLNATGALMLNLNDYVQGQPWCQALSAKLQLNAANISSNFGGVEVEKAQVVISCNNGDVVAVMKPKTNSLGIDAKMVIDSKRQLTLTGFVKPPANAPRDFVNLLKFTGKPDSQGRFELSFNQPI